MEASGKSKSSSSEINFDLDNMEVDDEVFSILNTLDEVEFEFEDEDEQEDADSKETPKLEKPETVNPPEPKTETVQQPSCEMKTGFQTIREINKVNRLKNDTILQKNVNSVSRRDPRLARCSLGDVKRPGISLSIAVDKIVREIEESKMKGTSEIMVDELVKMKSEPKEEKKIEHIDAKSNTLFQNFYVDKSKEHLSKNIENVAEKKINVFKSFYVDDNKERLNRNLENVDKKRNSAFESFVVDKTKDQLNKNINVPQSFSVDKTKDQLNKNIKVVESFPVDKTKDQLNKNIKVVESFAVDKTKDQLSNNIKAVESFAVDKTMDQMSKNIKVLESFAVDKTKDQMSKNIENVDEKKINVFESFDVDKIKDQLSKVLLRSGAESSSSSCAFDMKDLCQEVKKHMKLMSQKEDTTAEETVKDTTACANSQTSPLTSKGEERKALLFAIEKHLIKEKEKLIKKAKESNKKNDNTTAVGAEESKTICPVNEVVKVEEENKIEVQKDESVNVVEMQKCEKKESSKKKKKKDKDASWLLTETLMKVAACPVKDTNDLIESAKNDLLKALAFKVVQEAVEKSKVGSSLKIKDDDIDEILERPLPPSVVEPPACDDDGDELFPTLSDLIESDIKGGENAIDLYEPPMAPPPPIISQPSPTKKLETVEKNEPLEKTKETQTVQSVVKKVMVDRTHLRRASLSPISSDSSYSSLESKDVVKRRKKKKKDKRGPLLKTKYDDILERHMRKKLKKKKKKLESKKYKDDKMSSRFEEKDRDRERWRSRSRSPPRSHFRRSSSPDYARSKKSRDAIWKDEDEQVRWRDRERDRSRRLPLDRIGVRAKETTRDRQREMRKGKRTPLDNDFSASSGSSTRSQTPIERRNHALVMKDAPPPPVISTNLPERPKRPESASSFTSSSSVEEGEIRPNKVCEVIPSVVSTSSEVVESQSTSQTTSSVSTATTTTDAQNPNLYQVKTNLTVVTPSGPCVLDVPYKIVFHPRFPYPIKVPLNTTSMYRQVVPVSSVATGCLNDISVPSNSFSGTVSEAIARIQETNKTAEPIKKPDPETKAIPETTRTEGVNLLIDMEDVTDDEFDNTESVNPASIEECDTLVVPSEINTRSVMFDNSLSGLKISFENVNKSANRKDSSGKVNQTDSAPEESINHSAAVSITSKCGEKLTEVVMESNSANVKQVIDNDDSKENKIDSSIKKPQVIERSVMKSSEKIDSNSKESKVGSSIKETMGIKKTDKKIHENLKEKKVESKKVEGSSSTKDTNKITNKSPEKIESDLKEKKTDSKKSKAKSPMKDNTVKIVNKIPEKNESDSKEKKVESKKSKEISSTKETKKENVVKNTKKIPEKIENDSKEKQVESNKIKDNSSMKETKNSVKIEKIAKKSSQKIESNLKENKVESKKMEENSTTKEMKKDSIENMEKRLKKMYENIENSKKNSSMTETKDCIEKSLKKTPRKIESNSKEKKDSIGKVDKSMKNIPEKKEDLKGKISDSKKIEENSSWKEMFKGAEVKIEKLSEDSMKAHISKKFDDVKKVVKKIPDTKEKKVDVKIEKNTKKISEDYMKEKKNKCDSKRVSIEQCEKEKVVTKDLNKTYKKDDVKKDTTKRSHKREKILKENSQTLKENSKHEEAKNLKENSKQNQENIKKTSKRNEEDLKEILENTEEISKKATERNTRENSIKERKAILGKKEEEKSRKQMSNPDNSETLSKISKSHDLTKKRKSVMESDKEDNIKRRKEMKENVSQNNFDTNRRVSLRRKQNDTQITRENSYYINDKFRSILAIYKNKFRKKKICKKVVRKIKIKKFVLKITDDIQIRYWPGSNGRSLIIQPKKIAAVENVSSPERSSVRKTRSSSRGRRNSKINIAEEEQRKISRRPRLEIMEKTFPKLSSGTLEIEEDLKGVDEGDSKMDTKLQVVSDLSDGEISAVLGTGIQEKPKRIPVDSTKSAALEILEILSEKPASKDRKVQQRSLSTFDFDDQQSNDSSSFNQLIMDICGSLDVPKTMEEIESVALESVSETLKIIENLPEVSEKFYRKRRKVTLELLNNEEVKMVSLITDKVVLKGKKCAKRSTGSELKFIDTKLEADQTNMSDTNISLESGLLNPESENSESKKCDNLLTDKVKKSAKRCTGSEVELTDMTLETDQSTNMLSESGLLNPESENSESQKCNDLVTDKVKKCAKISIPSEVKFTDMKLEANQSAKVSVDFGFLNLESENSESQKCSVPITGKGKKSAKRCTSSEIKLTVMKLEIDKSTNVSLGSGFLNLESQKYSDSISDMDSKPENVATENLKLKNETEQNVVDDEDDVPLSSLALKKNDAKLKASERKKKVGTNERKRKIINIKENQDGIEIADKEIPEAKRVSMILNKIPCVSTQTDSETHVNVTQANMTNNKKRVRNRKKSCPKVNENNTVPPDPVAIWSRVQSFLNLPKRNIGTNVNLVNSNLVGYESVEQLTLYREIDIDSLISLLQQAKEKISKSNIGQL